MLRCHICVSIGAVVLLVSSTILGGVVTGYEWQAAHAVWGNCNRTAECTMVDVTCGMPQAINKKFLSDYSQWVKKQYENVGVIDCISVPSKYYVAECTNGQCTATKKKSSN